jgi:hypothetical protein
MLQRALIDCRTRFLEHGQLHVTPSRAKNPGDLCIFPPNDTDDFII